MLGKSQNKIDSSKASFEGQEHKCKKRIGREVAFPENLPLAGRVIQVVHAWYYSVLTTALQGRNCHPCFTDEHLKPREVTSFDQHHTARK